MDKKELKKDLPPQTELELYWQKCLDGLKDYGINRAMCWLYSESTENFNTDIHFKTVGEKDTKTFQRNQYMNLQAGIPVVSLLVYGKGTYQEIRELLSQDMTITPGFNFSTGYRTL